MNFVEYNEDRDSTRLEAGSYLCKLEYPDGRKRIRVKRFYIYGVTHKRGYFATNGRKYKITHILKLEE